jgi:hypothetical protein
MGSMREIGDNEIDAVNGGFRTWLAIIAYEVIDVITSNGDNLKTAFENGKEAASN